jgi:hypothetical protein
MLTAWNPQINPKTSLNPHTKWIWEIRNKFNQTCNQIIIYSKRCCHEMNQVQQTHKRRQDKRLNDLIEPTLSKDKQPTNLLLTKEITKVFQLLEQTITLSLFFLSLFLFFSLTPFCFIAWIRRWSHDFTVVVTVQERLSSE